MVYQRFSAKEFFFRKIDENKDQMKAEWLKVRNNTFLQKSNKNKYQTRILKWKWPIHKDHCISPLFMDLSKAFDTIKHNLMLAKLRAYDFSKEALNVMKMFLKNRKQKVQNNKKSSFEKDVTADVPQGSIDSPFLFDLFINGLVLFIQNSTLSNYADGSNLFLSGKGK